MQEVETIDSIAERVERDGADALTEPERLYRAIWNLEGQTSNGSFHQFFWNAPGSLAREALAGLRAVGASAMAESLEAAIALFPGSSIPDPANDRRALLDAMSVKQLAAMDVFSDRFADYPENLGSLLESYVRDHDDEFLGPRTLLDMWHSKRARGADTQPGRVAPTVDLTIEAERDRAFSTRPCPQCAYPSPDYRVTCKRCGYPHGRKR